MPMPSTRPRVIAAAQAAGRRDHDRRARPARRCSSTALARDGFAQRLRVRHAGQDYDMRLPLLGDYQASNALLAAGLAIAAGEPADRVSCPRSRSSRA